MAQKLLKTKNRKVESVTPGRVRTPTAPSAESRPIVLVGPYRADQMKKWILPKGYYNYPVGEEDDCTPAHCKRIKELWLYKGKSVRKVFSAEFLGVKTRAELPDYPATKTKPHGEKYLLFKVKELYGPQLENATVHVRVSDFTSRTPKIAAAIKAFQEGSKAKPKSAKHLQALGAAGILAEVLPGEIGQVPPERLCVREAAVQLVFPSLMMIKTNESSLKVDLDVASRSRTLRTAMSLFSGAGGLDIGVLQAGFDILSCVELDHNACDTLRRAVLTEQRRTKVYESDIKSISPELLLADLEKKPGEVDLLFGGPPCQAFSLIGKQKALDDERGMLLFQMIRYARAIRPRVVLMEQVKGLLSAKDTTGKRGGVFEMLLRDFEDLGYVVKYKVCLAADYGAAQLRERVILVATLDKNGFQFPPAKFQDPSKPSLLGALPPWRTVGDVLSGLGCPHPKEKGVTVYDDSFKNHVDVTPERDRERIRCVPEGLYLASQTHLPPDILGNLKARDTTKYLRLNRKRPSNTLRCGEIFFHPTEDRYLTPREYMRIHGYPDDYILEGPIRSRTGSVKNLDQHRQVANSVPPPLARAIAEQIMSYLENS